jgi:hypothetical protein
MLIACDDPKGTKEAEVEQSCDVFARLSFPDGTSSEYNACTNVLLDATYEFDPDKAPEIRSFKLQFTGTTDPDFECWMIITSHGICGPGRYDVGLPSAPGTVSTSIEFATYDCTGIADDFEGRFKAVAGIHQVEIIDGGDRPGNFEGEHLLTTFKGAITAQTHEGISMEMTYAVEAYIRGTDAQETTCLPAG